MGEEGCVGGLEGGLRMLENHLWTANAGELSAGEEEGEFGVESRVSDLLRLCFADLVRISPL